MGDQLELTMRDVVEAHEGVQQLIERYKTELAVGVSLRLARLARQLRPEVELYEQCRRQLVQAHGEQTESGWRVPPAGMEAFAVGERELLAQTTSLPIAPIALEELGLARVDADVILLILPVLRD